MSIHPIIKPVSPVSSFLTTPRKAAISAGPVAGVVGKPSLNAHQWRAVGDFLDVQWLASLGLRMVAHGAASRGQQ